MSFQALLCFLNSKHMTMENQDIYIYIKYVHEKLMKLLVLIGYQYSVVLNTD